MKKYISLFLVGGLCFGVYSLVAMNDSQISEKSDESDEESEKEEKNKKDSYVEEKNKEAGVWEELDTCLMQQKYRKMTNILEGGIYPSEKANPVIGQWLVEKRDILYEVPVLYAYFRYIMKSCFSIVPPSWLIEQIMKDLIIVTVLTQGDYEVRCKLTGIFKQEKAENPVTLLLKNYKHRLKDRSFFKNNEWSVLAAICEADKSGKAKSCYSWVKKLSFKEVVQSAKKEFEERAKEEFFYTKLPCVAWVSFVTNMARASVWVDFLDVTCDKESLKLYKEELYAELIKKTRTAIYQFVFDFLATINSWEEFLSCGTGTINFSKKYKNYKKTLEEQ